MQAYIQGDKVLWHCKYKTALHVRLNFDPSLLNTMVRLKVMLRLRDDNNARYVANMVEFDIHIRAISVEAVLTMFKIAGK